MAHWDLARTVLGVVRAAVVVHTLEVGIAGVLVGKAEVRPSTDHEGVGRMAVAAAVFPWLELVNCTLKKERHKGR
jgi:hypothetical protein